MVTDNGQPTFAPIVGNTLLENARVVASRTDILPLLPKDITFAEVGVALGDFTAQVLNTCVLRQFIAIDRFDLEKYPNMWNGRVGKELRGHTHHDFYKSHFKKHIDDGLLTMMVGDSVRCLRDLPDKSVDVFYVDANHSYKNVKSEIEVIEQKIKQTGLIIFNDYMMFDWLGNEKYGVVQAVNEFMIEKQWELVYFALHPGMFCDVAVRKLKR